MQVLGANLKQFDIVKVWWMSEGDMLIDIISIGESTHGVFENFRTGMTLIADEFYTVLGSRRIVKKNKVKPGDLVAVNLLDNSQLYRVNTINNFAVSLVYLSPITGQILNGGMSDTSVLLEPTKKQLLNHIKILESRKKHKSGSIENEKAKARQMNLF